MAAALLLSSAAPARAFEPGLDFDQGVAVPAVLRAAREHAAPSLDVERVRGPLAAHPRAVWILKSSGVCDGCAEAISKMLFTVGIPSQILGPGQLKSAVKPNDLIVIGGGIPDSDGEWTIKQDLMKAGAFEWVKQHIANGGRYVGICAGAYLTEKWIDQDNGEHGLDIFPGKIDNYTEGKKTKYLLTHWKNGVSRRVYFQDGPAMVPDPGADISVWATFAKDDTPAAAIFPYGKGVVGLLSPHLEADEDWAAQANLKDPDGLDYDLGIAFIRKVME